MGEPAGFADIVWLDMCLDRQPKRAISPRLLLIGFHTPLKQAAVHAALDKLEAEGSRPPFLGLVSREDFLAGRADVWLPDVRGFRDLGFAASRAWPLPPRELWERLQAVEAVVMQMMDRTWRVARAGKRHESRKRRWIEWVAFAFGFLTEHRVERVLSCNVPHFPFQYVLFEVARAMGLETRFLMQLQVKDTYLVAPSIDELHEPVGRALTSGYADAPLEPRMQAELKRRTTRHKPFYMSAKGIPAWERFYAAQRRFFRGRLRMFPAAAAYRAARRKRGELPETGRAYIYLPLHLQPEATTLPLGGVYGEQALVVETLARALPEDWLLVVKENPKQRFDKRSSYFYRRLADLECVRLVSRDVSSFDLIEGCRAVATITGSAGWEALCSGKPTLVFGKAFYRHAPGATIVESPADARVAMAAIADGSYPFPTKGDCARFLAALQAVTYAGVCDTDYLRDTECSEEESLASCTGAVFQGICGTASVIPASGTAPMAKPSPDRVLIFGFRRLLNQEALKRALAVYRPECLGLISRSNFLEGLADEFLSARHGFRACTFEANIFKAFPPATLFEALKPNEVVALRMYERIFRGARTGQAYELRRRLWLQHVAWAYGLLVEGGYGKLIFSEIPHHPFPYVLHSVARALGLDVRFFAQVQVKDTHVLCDGIEGMFDPVGKEYRRMVAAGEEATYDDLAPHLRVEVDRRTGRHQPFYMGVKDLSWRRKLYQRSKKFFRADDRLRVHRTIQNGLAYWAAHRPVPAVGERFVYFPLHLQPEATTSPMGGVFVDQYLALETLVRALPEGWKVVVKENPAQRFAKRDTGFYEYLRAIDQVHLVSRKVSTFDLIERSEAVATITGTAGWEALFNGKPSIVFGRAFYREAPGVIAVEDTESLAFSLRAVRDGIFEVCSLGELQRFLKALERVSFHGVVDTAYLRDSDLPLEESIARHAKVLETLLRGE